MTTSIDREAQTRKRWERITGTREFDRNPVLWTDLDDATREVLVNAKPAKPLVPSVKGHACRHTAAGDWCECGHYLGGLGYVSENDPPAREAHELHRAVVLAHRAAKARS